VSGFDATSRPRVRQVEALPVVSEGRRCYALRDPALFSGDVLVVTPETLFVVFCLDGTRTPRDVQEACFRRFQEIVPLDQILHVVESLEKALLLDSEAFRARRAAVEKAFLSSDVRPATHAGTAYAKEPDALRSMLDDLLGGAAASTTSVPGGRLVGLIAPHIDLHRGGPGYGAAYRVLAARSRASTFVVLGTVHAAPPEPYTATRKAYDTPLGAVPADTAFIDALARRYGERLFTEESAHRGEHSIEFQAVLLRHLFGDTALRIVPILCSSFHEHVESGKEPREDDRVASFIDALGAVLAEFPDSCLIAGADLAHLGPRFGDEARVGKEIAYWCEVADRATLDRAGTADAGGFFGAIAIEKDRRRVCGISAIYTFLSVLPAGSAGTLLHYGQALDEEGTTFVSFASMAFTAPA